MKSNKLINLLKHFNIQHGKEITNNNIKYTQLKDK